MSAARSTLGFVVLATIAVAACDQGGAHFSVRYASDFSPARHAVSVLGAYQDGRMSTGAWEDLAPHLVPALGEIPCEGGFDALTVSDPPVASAIDEFARDDGPTDALLAQLAPAAKGDSILVITLSGHLPQPTRADGGAPPPRPSAGGGRRAGHGMRSAGQPRAPGESDGNVLEISALLYSVAKAQSVALVAMEYSGASVEDAETKFAARLAQALPSMACAGWDWAGKVDAERIRSSIDQ
jgi:hypothetical protein